MSQPDTRSTKRPRLSVDDLLSADYVEEAYVVIQYLSELASYYVIFHSHIQAFSDALGADELLNDHQEYASSPNIPGTPVSPAPRVRKVSALSDFAPVNLRVKRSVCPTQHGRRADPSHFSSRRRRKDKPHDKRNDWLFLLLRWPILV
jgi:hypothetical protein